MPLSETISLILLGVTWGVQLVLRPLLNWMIAFSWRAGALAIFGVASYFMYLQYDIWRSNPLGKFFLSDTWYFFDYAGTRFLAPWVLAFVVAILAGRLVGVLNGYFGERFMEQEEIPLFALGTFLAGYPGFIVYFVMMILGALVLTVIYAIRKRGRAPLYFLWLPVAIFAILIKTWLVPKAVLEQFIL